MRDPIRWFKCKLKPPKNHCYPGNWIVPATYSTIHNILLRFWPNVLNIQDNQIAPILTLCQSMRISFKISSIQTGCLSAGFSEFWECFQKIGPSTLRMYLRLGNIDLLHEDFSDKNEQKWRSPIRTGVIYP